MASSWRWRRHLTVPLLITLFISAVIGQFFIKPLFVEWYGDGPFLGPILAGLAAGIAVGLGLAVLALIERLRRRAGR